VVTQQVTGCLSYWVGDDSQANIWGQVGYYICDGSTPVAFYQVWNLNTSSVLSTGTTPVSSGSHFFSMYLEYGTVWAFALDGSVFGTQDMQSSVSSSTHPVQAVNEEGEVSAPWNPSQVQFGTAIQIEQYGIWNAVASAFEPWGCGGSAQSCWGVQGSSQSPALAGNVFVVGGSTPALALGSTLWSAPSATTTTTTTITSSAASATTSTSTSVTNRQFSISVAIIPEVNVQKSTEYFTVEATDSNGNPIGGATISLTVTTPVGGTYTLSGMTNDNGLVYLQHGVGASAPLGNYHVSTVAMAAGYPSARTTGSFVIV